MNISVALLRSVSVAVSCFGRSHDKVFVRHSSIPSAVKIANVLPCTGVNSMGGGNISVDMTCDGMVNGS